MGWLNLEDMNHEFPRCFTIETIYEQLCLKVESSEFGDLLLNTIHPGYSRQEWSKTGINTASLHNLGQHLDLRKLNTTRQFFANS